MRPLVSKGYPRLYILLNFFQNLFGKLCPWDNGCFVAVKTKRYTTFRSKNRIYKTLRNAWTTLLNKHLEMLWWRKEGAGGGNSSGDDTTWDRKSTRPPKIRDWCLIYVEPLWHDKRSSKSFGKTSSILFPRYNWTGSRSAAGLISWGFSVPCSGGGPSPNAEKHRGKKTHPPRFLRWPKARLALCCS